MPESSKRAPSPALEEEIRAQGLRRGLVRSAIIWTPIAVVLIGALIFFAFDEATGGDRGSWFFVGVLTLFSGLTGTMAYSALRDLMGAPAEIEGYVRRSWSRTDSFVVRNHYIKVGKQIIRTGPVLYGLVKEGDYVRVDYFKHSSLAIRIEKIQPPEHEGKPAGARQAS